MRRRAFVSAVAALAVLLTLSMSAVSAADRAGAFRVALTGDQEVVGTCAPPAVCGDPDAIGRIVVIVNAQQNTVCFVTRWAGIDGTVVAGHIHEAPAGVAGPVRVTLFMGTVPRGHGHDAGLRLG